MDESWRTEISSHLLTSAQVKHLTAETCVGEILQAAGLIAGTLRRGGKLLLCGNGGSAADCQHIAAEFTSVLSPQFLRPALAAIALTTDTSFLTANANDFGFDGIYARQVEALGKPEDTLIGISTSGNSRNVLNAVLSAKQKGMHTVGLTGTGGGELARLAEVVIRVPSDNTAHIQETHITIGHILCRLAEVSLFSQADGREEGEPA